MQIDPLKFQEEINQFFDFSKQVPEIFKDGIKLREEYIKRENYLKKISLCFACEVLQFRAFFIDKLIKNLDISVNV